MASIPEISVPPEIVFSIGSLPISNAMLSSFVVTLILFAYIIFVRLKISMVPGRAQVIAESVISFFYDNLVSAYGNEKRAKKYLPMIVGLFLFILVANQFSLIPLVSSIVYGEVNVFRPPTSHFSLTLILALITFVTTQVIAFTISPPKYIGNFIKIGELLKVRSVPDFLKALLDIFLGFMDIIGELAKIVSLSARLFGNIFAGEVMIAVISGISDYTQFIIPMPFYLLSAFSGAIQALVFAILSLSFISGMHNSVRSQKEAAIEAKKKKKKMKINKPKAVLES